MRIALDATYGVDPHPSGIAVYSRELLAGLAENYPEDKFLHCYRLKQFLGAQRIPFPNVGRRVLLPPLGTFTADLFHSLNQRVDRRPAKNVISTFHDLFVMTGEYSSPEFRVRFTQQARQAAQNSDLIIAVSEFTASQVTQLLDFPRSRMRVVHHGVHLPRMPEGTCRENFILFVGALQIRKNVGRLVQAFERLSPDWRLILAGSPRGYQAGVILQQIESSAARERIEVTGYISESEIHALYSRASIFAMPSLDEGFGIPVLEAMAHGVPVITSNRSALPEVAGEAALLVNPYEADEIEVGLKRLIQDSNLRTKLSKLGRARAELSSWEKAVRSTYATYEILRDVGTVRGVPM